MENKKLNGTETEVTTAEFNRYFNENYPYISHSLSNKEVEKWLNQDVIKRVSLSKKADYFQDYILSQGLEDDVQMMAGGNIQPIEKKVAEVNELIEMGNKNNVNVTDTSSTWQSPMKYKPFVYKSGVLYENYEELDLYLYSKKGEKNWRIVKHKYTKIGDGVDTQKEVLNNVAKMYRKELKYYADYDNYLLRTKGKMMAGGNTEISEPYSVAVSSTASAPVSAQVFMAGGSIDNENKLMVANNNKQLRHHTEELENALQNAKHIPAWVVSLVGRATQDISDVTHYLDGTMQYGLGGEIDNGDQFNYEIGGL